MLTLITHALALLAGLAAGWLGHKKYGKVADAVVTAVQTPPKP